MVEFRLTVMRKDCDDARSAGYATVIAGRCTWLKC